MPWFHFFFLLFFLKKKHTHTYICLFIKRSGRFERAVSRIGWKKTHHQMSTSPCSGSAILADLSSTLAFLFSIFLKALRSLLFKRFLVASSFFSFFFAFLPGEEASPWFSFSASSWASARLVSENRQKDSQVSEQDRDRELSTCGLAAVSCRLQCDL